MNAPRIAALAAVLLMSSAPIARAEVNNVISETGTARLKATPNSQNGTPGKNDQTISTSRSNIKNGGHNLNKGVNGPKDGTPAKNEQSISTSRSNIKHGNAIPKQSTCQPGKKC